MSDSTCLPHLDDSGRRNRWLIAIFVVMGAYGIAAAMLLLRFPVEVCVATSAAVTVIAQQAAQSVMTQNGPLLPDLAALPPRA